MRQAVLGEEHISPPARRLAHVVFEQAMDQVYIGANQLGNAAHLLYEIIPLVGQKLEIEIRDAAAGVALTGGPELNRHLPIPKSDISALEQIQQ